MRVGGWLRSFIRAGLAAAVLVSGGGCAGRQLPEPQVQGARGEVENLRVFAKLYGYIRYFHPSDEASRIDWDRFAIDGVEAVRGAQSSDELQDKLRGLFATVAPTLQLFLVGSSPPPLPSCRYPPGDKVVAWQHLGFGFGVIRSAYESRRSHRSDRQPDPRTMGSIAQRVLANLHRRKLVRLSAAIRASGPAEDRAELWLDVGGSGAAAARVLRTAVDRGQGESPWRRYVVVGRVAPDAGEISVGVLLRGTGRLWVDDFRLEVEEAPGRWSDVALDNAGFEHGERLQLLNWESSSADYRYLAIPDPDPPQGMHVLRIERDDQALLFEALPSLGEFVEKPLGGGLVCRFPLALPSTMRTSCRPGGVPPSRPLEEGAGAARAIRLDAADERVRIGDVIIAWNVFQHFYPYFDVVRVDWDQVLTAALQKALEDRNARDFDGTLRRMVAALHDGHGRVVDQNETSRPGYPPWLVEMIEGRVVVTASVVPAKLRPGDIVVAIDGEPVSTVIARLENERSGSPQWRRFLALRELGQGDPGSAARLGIVRRGVQLTVDVQRLDRPALLEFERPARQRLPGGVEYVDLTRTTTEQISADMAAIASAPGVVFDLRGYPKPSPDFLEHLLTEKDTSGAWMQVPEIIRPDQERISGWQREGWGLAPRAPRISGRVAFITGPMAVSYAESILSIVEHYRLGAIVGQATAGTNGNINPFLLPGRFKVFWTGMRVVKHDGSQHHLIGIQPTVPVARTLAGVLAHRDELLEVALRLVSPSTIR